MSDVDDFLKNPDYSHFGNAAPALGASPAAGSPSNGTAAGAGSSADTGSQGNQSQSYSDMVPDVLPYIGGAYGAKQGIKAQNTYGFGSPAANSTPQSPTLSDVEIQAQSHAGTGEELSGRQKEQTHNAETQRQAAATKANLRNMPGAEQQLINAGRQVTSRGGIYIPEMVGESLEQEANAKKAADIAAKAGLPIPGWAKGVLGFGGGALAGYGVASDLEDMLRDYKRNNTSGMVLHGVDALGNLSTFFMPTVPGLAVLGAIHGTKAYGNYVQKHPTALPQYDEYGNPINSGFQ